MPSRARRERAVANISRALEDQIVDPEPVALAIVDAVASLTKPPKPKRSRKTDETPDANGRAYR